MSYLVFARKYRPKRFEEVVGQNPIIQTLSNALLSGRIAHAFLFTGSRGTGKTTVARLLAKALVCEQGVSKTPCEHCTICQDVSKGTCLDVVEIDGASHTSVDHMRDLRETIRYQPTRARFKIFIIDEVHMLSTSAFNALLKTLEEPPPYAKLIFATTEPHKVPATIVSRCQRYDFRRLSTHEIVSNLQSILQQEQLHLPKEAVELIAQAAQGGLRDAQSLLDQVLSFANETSDIQEIAQILGFLDQRSIDSIGDALIKRDLQSALHQLERAYNRGYDLKRILESIATLFKDLAITSFIPSTTSAFGRSKEEFDALHQWALTLDPRDLKELFSLALEGMAQIAQSDLPKLSMELAFLNMVHRPELADLAAIERAIDRLSELSCSAKNTDSTQKKGLSQPALNKPTPNISNTPNAQPPKQRFAALVKAVSEKNPLLGHHLEHCRVHHDGQGQVRLELEHKVHHQALVLAQRDPEFLSLFHSLYGSSTKLDVVLLAKAQTGEGPLTLHQAKEQAKQEEQTQLEQRAKEDPIIQKALALFGGEIHQVKKPNLTHAQLPGSSQ